MFKLALLFCLLLALAHTSELDKIKTDVATECVKEHPVDSEDIKNIFNLVSVPEKEHVKCFLSCVLKKLNVLHDGKYDWAACSELIKKDLTLEEDKAKVDRIAEICQKEVTSVGDDCELAYNAVVCKIKHANELNLPHGTWEGTP